MANNLQKVDDRLLEAAIDHFGRLGMDGASTRAIADAAGTAMSSITYHYGGKRDLYLAAARHIAGRMEELLAPVLDPSETAETTILPLVDRFAEIMLHPESAAWARFALREQMEPTEAFDILYRGGLGRIVDRIASHLGGNDARLKAFAIIGQVLVFRVARAAVLRATGWTDIDEVNSESIRDIVREHTAAILSGYSRD